MLRRIAITLAVASSVTPAFAPAADAMHRGARHHAAAKPKLLPAHLRPGYVGAPGYPGGGPGPAVPTLVDFGGGLPLVGAFPGARLFVGVPVLDQLGL